MEGFIGVDYFEDGEEKTIIYNQDSIFKFKIEKAKKDKGGIINEY